MDYVVTFFTNSGAIKFQRFLIKNNIEVKLMPVPRKVSSSCGTAAKIKFMGDLKDIIIEDIDSVYLIESNDFKLLYKHP